MADFDDGWLLCEVIDLSVDGAALLIPKPAGEPHGRLVLELRCDGQPTGPQLRAVVRHWDGAAEGGVRVGVEFYGTTNLERYTLANLVSRQRRASTAP